MARAEPRHGRLTIVRQGLIYGLLILWALICLFPIYWTVTTSFKVATDIYARAVIPWIDFQPGWKGWETLGLSRDTIELPNSKRDNFFKHFRNTLVVAVGSALFATTVGSMAGYGLSRFQYRFGPWRNRDIQLWFLSQLILPPIALAMPLLILYRELDLLDSHAGLMIAYTIMSLPIVIWIMRDQFNSIPTDLEEAAQVDGASVWQAFARIIVPISGPGFVAAFILALILACNEYFLAIVLTSTDAVTLPFLIAGQVSSQGVAWWSMAAIATAAIAPLLIIGVLLERYIVKGLTAGAVK